jgi:hypothetical protein
LQLHLPWAVFCSLTDTFFSSLLTQHFHNVKAAKSNRVLLV